MSTDEVNQALKIAIQLHMNDHFQDAFNYYATILKSDPDNKQVMYLLGVLLLQNGVNDHGADLIEKSTGGGKAEQRFYSFSDSIGAKYAAEHDNLNCDQSWPVYDGTTVDKWRHLRMIDFVPCFADDTRSWLTVGDAYGHDSIRLRHYGVTNVVASNLTANFLRSGHEAGAIGEYREINAEKIDFPDNSFDYVLCKEALHHMPRASLAIHEMLRVARKAVFLVEPQDTIADLPLTFNQSFWYKINGNELTIGKLGESSPIISRLLDWHEEDAKNYVYTISRREIAKICYGMGLPGFCYKGLNDCYNAEWASQPATGDSEGFKKTSEKINLYDTLCAATGLPYIYLIGLLFKEFPDNDCAGKLETAGYTLSRTPTRFLPVHWPEPK